MTLKLNGSSSGYVAIDAPAAAGSNTLVLPADNGSANEVLKTDGSGNLDWTAISVGGASGTDYNDNVKVRFGTGNDLEIFHNSENSYIKDTGTGALVISTSDFYLNNAADTATVLKATETGTITTPKQPACIVTTSANTSISSGSNKYPFNSVSYERHQGSSNFDTTNHKFTCPVAGIYHFDIALNIYSFTGHNMRLSLKKNGSTNYEVQRQYWEIGDQTIGGSMVLNAAANDYFEVFYNASDTGSGSGGIEWARWSTVLIG